MMEQYRGLINKLYGNNQLKDDDQPRRGGEGAAQGQRADAGTPPEAPAGV